MALTRGEFIRVALKFTAAAAVIPLVGTGCDDSSGSGGAGGTGTTSSSTKATTGSGSSTGAGGHTMGCGAAGTEISANHGHELVIPAADLDATTDKTYSIMGTAVHDHTVTFTAAQLAMLKAKTPVTVTSSAAVHTHMVTASCI
ncbi:MAG: hypothetical protein U0414_14730 [Polyangiaceae bacterium]